MKSIKLAQLVALLVTSLAVPSAQAAVVFEYARNFGGPSYVSEPDGDQIASRFTLDTSEVITDIHWWGAYSGDVLPANDEFTVKFFDQTGNNSGPVPTGTPFKTVGQAGLLNFQREAVTGETTVSGNQIYKYSADFQSPINFAAASYWLSILNDVQPDEWGWLSTTDGSTAQSALFRGGQWLGEGAAFAGVPTDASAFQLTGDNVIPEPVSLAVWSTLGMLGIGIAMRRRWRR